MPCLDTSYEDGTQVKPKFDSAAGQPFIIGRCYYSIQQSMYHMQKALLYTFLRLANEHGCIITIIFGQ